MERFFQAAAGAMAAVVMWIILSKQGKEYGMLLSVGACCLVLIGAMRFLGPSVDLLGQLKTLGNLQAEWLSVMLKATGIGLIAELGSMICTDAGNGALGKTLQFMGTAAVLWLSIPLINSLLALLEQILGEI